MTVGTDATLAVVARGRIDWTPYLMGAGIGVLSWAAFAIADDPLGITTALSAVAGFVAMPLVGVEAVWRNSYWTQAVPNLSYGTLFLIGVFLGGFAASVGARQFRFETVPMSWGRRFGPSPARRLAAAFAGGAVEMYGARLAGGCASGHGISGTLQLALSSWVFTILMFATAVTVGSYVFGASGDRQ
jgi:uncharacterized protein